MKKHKGSQELLNAVTIVLAGCAVIVTATRLWQFDSSGAPRHAAAITKLGDWERYAVPGIRLGSKDTPVTLIEFGDVRCPICAEAAPYVFGLLRRFPGELDVVFRHFPIHPGSFEDALALECAAARGRFEPMYRRLAPNRDSPANAGPRRWSSIAAAVGVKDITGFRECMASKAAAAAVVKDTLTAFRLRLSGTPTFILGIKTERDGQLIRGYLGRTEMDKYIGRAIERARTSRQ